MKDKDRDRLIVILIMAVALLLAGIILMAVKMDHIYDRLDHMERGTAAEYNPVEVATPTEATVTDATPEDATPIDATVTDSIVKNATLGFVGASRSDFLDEGEDLCLEDEKIDSGAFCEITEAPQEVPESSGSGGSYLGYYELTAYEETGYCCANGNYPTVGYTVACNSLPLGTRIYIEGYGEYVVEDRLADWMSGDVIDIYLGDPGACVQFGRQGANVYLVQ